MNHGRFITLDRSSPDFHRYLLGEFSSEYRALPMQSLNVNRVNEKVTFHVVPFSEIGRPPLIVVLAQIFRVDLLTLTLTPAVVVAMLLRERIFNLQHIWFTLLSLVFLHGAVFCRNDFIDHIRGADRLNEKGGSRVIQRGWLRAVSVQRLYWGMLAVAVFLALPVLMALPGLLALSAIAAILGVVGYSHLRWGIGHWFLGDFAVLICLGPLLALSVSWVVLGGPSVDALLVLIGLYFGLLALVYVELRHTISIVIDDESGLATLPVQFGFDGAKTAIIALWAVVALIGVSIFTLLQPGPFSLLALPLIGWICWLAKFSYTITSPLSSALYECPRRVIQLHILSGIYFVVMSFF